MSALVSPGTRRAEIRVSTNLRRQQVALYRRTAQPEEAVLRFFHKRSGVFDATIRPVLHHGHPFHEDDTGKLLSTRWRLAEMPFLTQEVKSSHHKANGKKNGPVISLQFDAPAREAATIKSIKGKGLVLRQKRNDSEQELSR